MEATDRAYGDGVRTMEDAELRKEWEREEDTRRIREIEHEMAMRFMGRSGGQPYFMDKFLQILEDGRMTDGQGQTVYFSETIIFFTSNVGISEELLDEHGRIAGRRNIVHPGEPYDAIRAKVEAAMATHFKPEVLNRIGDNIVVFDYISPEASRLILQAQLAKINGNVRARCGITVAASAALTEHLLEAAMADEVRERGGRGIGNLVENAYLNPLATFIFDNGIERGEAVEALLAHGAVAFRRATDDGRAPLVGAAGETACLAPEDR